MAPYDNQKKIIIYFCGHKHRCKLDVENDNDNTILAADMVLSRKCQHFHLSWCQNTHLATLDTEFPHTLEGLDSIRNSSAKGCYCCHNDIQDTPQQSDLMHEVRFTPNMPAFVELGNNTPDNVSFPPLPTPPPPAASGANAVPIAPVQRTIDRPRSPPPPRPTGTREERRDRSPLRQRNRDDRQERSGGARRRN